MKTNLTTAGWLTLLALTTLNLQPSTAVAQGTAFTYQGRLNANSSPAAGLYDFRFRLASDSSGNTILATATTNGVPVTNGLFAASIDFGAEYFNGSNCWLEVDVRTNGASSYTALNPLQALMATPFAIFASNSATASTATTAATVANGVYTSGSYANPGWITSLAGSKLSGNISGNAAGFAGSLAGDVTGTQSATVVAGVGGQTAANVASGASAANAATSGATAGALVKRDATASFSAANLTLTSNLYLLAPSATAGLIYAGLNTLINGAGSSFFGGVGAGNLTSSGSGQVGVGYQALQNITSGDWNTAVGIKTLANNTNGTDNTACGDFALYSNGNGLENTAIGNQAMQYNVSGSFNTAVGSFALYNSYNAVGDNNIALGFEAGSSLSNGNNNIDIGNAGVATDANIIRIGAGQAQTFIAGAVQLSNGLFMNNQDIQLRGDLNHGVGWYGNGKTFAGTTPDGPVLYGYSGGALGTQQSGSENIALSWDASGNVNTASLNADSIQMNGNVVMWDHDIRLRGDPNHGVGWYGASKSFAGASLDGPVLYGFHGGGLGSTINGTNLALAWDYNGDVMIDPTGINTGALLPGLTFGTAGSGEGISSKRTPGTDQFGLDFYTGGSVRMTIDNNGNVGIGTTSPGNWLTVGNGGSPAYCDGVTWVNGSDRKVKAGFQPVDAAAILQKVASIPITTWHYTNDVTTPHLGPMAQDFYQSFGLWADDTHIATVDEGGVALAAIQGLNQKLAEKDGQIQELKARLDKLERLMEARNEAK
jgi:hypothetical protein